MIDERDEECGTGNGNGRTAQGDRQTLTRRRHYSDREKCASLLLLEANEGNYTAAAEQAGVPRPNLYAWKEGRGLPPDTLRQVDEQRGLLADKFEEVAHQIIDHVLSKDGPIPQGSLQQCLIAAGIAVDKMRLLREQATDIHARQMSDEERVARLNELLATALTLPEPALEQSELALEACYADTDADTDAAHGS